VSTFAPLVGVTLRGLLGRRRTVLMVLLVALPVVVALIIRLAGGRPDAPAILDTLVIRTVLPLVALVFGTSALGSDLEDGTAVFLLAKPIRRWQVVLAKMGVAAGLTIALVMPATVATGLLAAGLGADAIGTAFGYALASAIGGVAYACAFVALSAWTSRALVAGLAYTLLWEGALSGLLEGTRFLSVRQATLGIAAELSGIAPSVPPLTFTTSLAIVAVIVVGAIVLGTFRLARFEVRGGD
jgi:ABC-2 type transport system permease protein